MSLISKIKSFFKKAPVIPEDPHLLQIYKNHALITLISQPINKYGAFEHPFWLQNDEFTSWAAKTPKGQKTVIKIPKMGGSKISARELHVGDVVIFATVKFGYEKVYWTGVVKVKTADRIILERAFHFCLRSPHGGKMLWV